MDTLKELSVDETIHTNGGIAIALAGLLICAGGAYYTLGEKIGEAWCKFDG